MPGTFPILELRQDGDVGFILIKQAGAKPVLKDIQTYLKKKTAPALLTAYPYGSKRVSMFGYVKGKETEVSQHQLPPPCEATELYGSIILIAHSCKSTWDMSPEPFSPGDYEVFYEKACSGELDEEDEDDYDGDGEEERQGGNLVITFGGSEEGADPMVPVRHNMKKESAAVKQFVKLITAPIEDNTIDTQIDQFKELKPQFPMTQSRNSW